ncbi:putative P450 monooxygenase [Saccharata proteae CBS 121410]|uniref:Putative P450 monooxygenase n=1 Tax=Saccharata proteae CBS 121410 TaxID=1314787 RepID=A0A6A5YCW3_9PEZI|nr:putative P450 monooxygenase [Saccharata proteae CBS 121410]
MAFDVPLPIALVLLSAPEALLVKTLIPDQNLRIPITPIVLGLISLNFALWVIYKVFIYPFFVSPLRHLPQPKGGYPILAHGLVLLDKPPGAMFLRWMKEVPNDGLIRFRTFFNVDRLIVTDPKAIADILVKNTYDFEKPKRARGFLRRILGDGLIIVEGDEHKFQRKNILPTFSFRHIKELYPGFWSKSLELCRGVSEEIQENPEYTSEKPNASTVEINHWATKVTLDIIGVAGLGRDFNSLKNSEDPLVNLYEEILEPTAEKTLFFTLHIIGMENIVKLLPWKVNQRMTYTTTKLREICRTLLTDKKSKLKLQSEEQKDILSVMLRTNLFGDDMLIDQLLTFLAAGHETTSSAFTWACYLLAVNPDVQSRLRAEVQEHLSAQLADPSNTTDLVEKLETMPYLNAVCNEVTRLYPTVPVTVRDAVRNSEIAGQFVPKGTQVLLVPWAINRSPKLWGADADEFKPERWIDADGHANNNGGAPSNYAILTFLHGPRSCIGQKFAQAELRALVAAFVGNFEWSLGMDEKDVIPAGVITTKPMNGMKLRLKKLEL